MHVKYNIQYLFYVLLNLHSCLILQIEPIWCTIFLNIFIAFLYMFRATMCPSSEENTIRTRHLIFVTPYRWLSGMQGGMNEFHSALHTTVRMRHLAFFTLYRWLSGMQGGMNEFHSALHTTVRMRHLAFFTLYRWLSGMQGGMNEFHSALHTRQSSIQSEKRQVSHTYGVFFWWWAHSCPKYVEKSDKYIKKNCVPSWFYLQDHIVPVCIYIYIYIYKTVFLKMNSRVRNMWKTSKIKN